MPASSGPEREADAAQVASEPSPQGASVFVVHQVPDWDAYRKQFERNAPARDSAGVTRVILSRLADDPHRVGLHFSAGSLDSVHKFLKSSEYARLADADRATESTLLWIAADELDELPSAIAAGSASLFKKFEVRDVDCVSSGLAAASTGLHEDGLLGFSLHRTENNSQVVILHLVAADRNAVEEVYTGPRLKPLLTGCGAQKLDAPIVSINELSQ